MNFDAFFLFKTCRILTKYFLYILVLIGFAHETGKNELMNGPSTMTYVLSNNKALEGDKFIIITSEVGSRKFPIILEVSINVILQLVQVIEFDWTGYIAYCSSASRW